MKGIKVLVIEDSSMAQRMYVRIFEQIGIEKYFLANDGDHALEILENPEHRENPFDLALCDWNMPGMDGLTLIKNLRNKKEFENLPIIMVTSETEKDRIMEAIKAKITHYVLKPFNKDTIREKIREVLKK